MSTEDRDSLAGADDVELRAERDALLAEVTPQGDRRRRTSELLGHGRA
jgi:hypothetical protein